MLLAHVFSALHHMDGLALARTCRRLWSYRRLAFAAVRFPARRGDEGYTSFAVGHLDAFLGYVASNEGRRTGVGVGVKSLVVYDREGDELVWPPRLPDAGGGPDGFEGEGGREGATVEAGSSEVETGLEDAPGRGQSIESEDSGDDKDNIDALPCKEAPIGPSRRTTIRTQSPSLRPLKSPPLPQHRPRTSTSTVHKLNLRICQLLVHLHGPRTLVIDARSASPLRAWPLPQTFFSARGHGALHDLAPLNVSVPRWRTMSHSLRRAVFRGGLTAFHRPPKSAQAEDEGQVERVKRVTGLPEQRRHEGASENGEDTNELELTLPPDVSPLNGNDSSLGDTSPSNRDLTPEECRARQMHERLHAYLNGIIRSIEPTRMGRRVEWAAGLLHNGWHMDLLDLHETFAGAWPGQPTDGGTGGGGWVCRVKSINRTSWRSLRVVNMRTEDDLMRFYEELMKTGTSKGAWGKVESLSLDARLSRDIWEVLANILPCMNLRRLRLVTYPEDETWEAELQPGGALGRLLARLPLLEELVVNCLWDIMEDEYVFAGPAHEWAATLALAPTSTLKRFTLPAAFTVSSTIDFPAAFGGALEEETIMTEDGVKDADKDADDHDSSYASGMDVPSAGTSFYTFHELPFSSCADQLELFAERLFAKLPQHASLSELIYLPRRNFDTKCIAVVYSRRSQTAREQGYKRFWEHDWEEWERMPDLRWPRLPRWVRMRD
ncbi:hypothetical protein C8Q79DRAFT_921988 [Trametes meyenii]|nr:hypothetical protein C8Q79DRAFT_921988 [Trametes meyenii]